MLYEVVNNRSGFHWRMTFQTREDAEKHFDAELRDVGGPVDLWAIPENGDPAIWLRTAVQKDIKPCTE